MTIKMTEFENSTCLKCNTMDYVMVRVGPMNFCKVCATHEFKYIVNSQVINRTVPEDKKDNYYKWLEIYKNML